VPVVAAERLDRGTGGAAVVIPALGPGGSDGSGRGGEASPSMSDQVASRQPVQAAALPTGFSSVTPLRTRIADLLPPGTNAAGDRSGAEPVYVPSASGMSSAPRQAELEEVAGRPVWVVYRPSAGLEVNDGDVARTTD
ncbi:MAG TPA: hypothetical protein VJT72_00300, partial [Pseudonocardiaceae bacterium]|nr:hypothetical protein [Pseudonocardiaceae bacterium]